MSSLSAVTSATSYLASAVSTLTDAVVPTLQAAEISFAMPPIDTNGGVFGVLRMTVAILYWLITGLPTWTFTFFQRSLTVTMNATTV